MERETTKVTLKSGKEVELKSYLTARERNTIRNIFLRDQSVEVNGEQQKGGKIGGDILAEAEEKSIEITVISLEGSTENIMQRINDGSPEQYDEISAEVQKIVSGNLAKAK